MYHDVTLESTLHIYVFLFFIRIPFSLEQRSTRPPHQAYLVTCRLAEVSTAESCEWGAEGALLGLVDPKGGVQVLPGGVSDGMGKQFLERLAPEGGFWSRFAWTRSLSALSQCSD